LDKSAPVKFAPARFSPLKSWPERFSPDKSAPATNREELEVPDPHEVTPKHNKNTTGIRNFFFNMSQDNPGCIDEFPVL
jgi:hypothetical protein